MTGRLKASGLRRAMGSRLAALLLMALTLALVPAAVRAQDVGAILSRFADDGFDTTRRAAEDLATSGHPSALPVLTALGEGALLVDPITRKVFYKTASGQTIAAETGQPATDLPAALRTVRVNNTLRRVVQGALGNLGILNPDPVKRLESAAAVFKSRDVTALPALEGALARETVPAIRSMMALARAAIVLHKADAPDAARLDAIATLAERGRQDVLGVLNALPADTKPILKEAAQRAASAIEANLALWANVQNAWYGLSLGSVLLLAAVGLAITFGVMGVINMAHGEMVMIGAYTTFMVQEVFRARYPGVLDYSLLVAVPAAFLVAGAIGVAIERGVIRFLYGRPLETLLATWGISLILQQAVRTIFGPSNREVSTPAFMSGTVELAGLAITLNRLWIIVFAGLVFVALLLILRFTSFGLEMRAVTQNRRMARAMGIRSARVDALTFGLGSGIAGLAGVALSQIDNVSPNLGQSYIIDSFLVVVFGGVGNLWGTLVGALSLGLANKFLEPYAGAVLGKILLLVLIILFIQKRPRGLFALKGRAVEA